MEDRSSGVSTVSEAFSQVRNASYDELVERIAWIEEGHVPLGYILPFPIEKRVVLYWFCLLAYYATGGAEVPHENQLKAALASYEGQDSLVIAGTGSGKTLVIALLLLINAVPERISITVSPLKRLQITQTENFNVKYSIKTVAINDDTPRNIEWWRDNVHNGKKGASQMTTASHFMVTAEQLFKSSEGHFSRLGLLVQDHGFRKRIGRIHVDEIHFTWFARTGRYGLDAFRKAWGRLGDLKLQLPSSIPWQGLTATCPPHVLHFIESSLLNPGYALIRMTSNRPNTMYARHCQ
ncbi:uncharacterized protein ARMOST_19581 [Armillaria ostoyae]|uniref:DNA 3'-5' helicase n=1 Tax=Armillaria ostoyae TaxID=47428 RepID=A0A284S4Z7_ARMOS|nr:uncharacterized protein ARMOST_19581 [Armillaria ostoyae]